MAEGVLRLPDLDGRIALLRHQSLTRASSHSSGIPVSPSDIPRDTSYMSIAPDANDFVQKNATPLSTASLANIPLQLAGSAAPSPPRVIQDTLDAAATTIAPTDPSSNLSDSGSASPASSKEQHTAVNEEGHSQRRGTWTGWIKGLFSGMFRHGRKTVGENGGRERKRSDGKIQGKKRDRLSSQDDQIVQAESSRLPSPAPQYLITIASATSQGTYADLTARYPSSIAMFASPAVPELQVFVTPDGVITKCSTA